MRNFTVHECFSKIFYNREILYFEFVQGYDYIFNRLITQKLLDSSVEFYHKNIQNL